MVKKIKKQQGVTLVALIITIIVMLILAGVSIGVVVNGEFFGKAQKANQMNENAIAKADLDEKNALKQNSEDFKVDEDFETEGIEAYEYVVSNGVGELKKIEYSLSKFVNENSSADVYFKATTSRTNLYYLINEVESEVATRVKEVESKTTKTDSNGEKYEVTSITLETAKGEDATTIIKVKATYLKDNLNGLKISATTEKGKKETTVYELEYEQKLSTKTTYISNERNTKIILDKNSEYNLMLLEGNGVDTTTNTYINKQIGEKIQLTSEENIYLSTKTSISKNGEKYASISQTNDEFVINTLGNEKSSVQDRAENLKLYLVREADITEEKIKTKKVYMDDCLIHFYNPISEIEIESPKTLEYRIKKENAKEIVPKYISVNNFEADVDTTTLKIELEKGDLNINNTIDGYMGEFELDNNKIYSTITSLPEGEITDVITIKANVADLGGKTVSTFIKIPIASNNFLVQAEKGTEVKTAYFKTLAEAIYGDTTANGAKYYIGQGYKTTIKQIIGEYSIEEELYTKETEKNEFNDIVEDKYYLDIVYKSDSKGNVVHNLNGLIYDLNGNNLTVKDEAKIRIAEGKTFTLKSSKDAYTEYNNHQNGTISFNHETTYNEKADLKYMSLENFFSVERYKHLKNIKTYLKSKGLSTTGIGYIVNTIKYTPEYLTKLMIGYKEYINSFNRPKFQNTNYKYTMEAIINNGTFNFESGKIQVTTDETVTAFGAFGGGVVINVAETFLTALRKLGIETASLTDYTASFAKLENTAVGVKNYGDVILGTGSGGVQNDAKPFPEISILIDSAANGIGLSVGSITNPNRVVSRAYGVWNAKDTATTTMNSGFIEMAITNNTNNWVSLNVGRTYGIFNDQGKTILNGFTKKKIIRDISIYGLITENLFKQYEIEGDNKIKNALKEALSKVDTFWENSIQKKEFEGFFSYSELQILYKGALGGTTCYTNSYAIANAERRSVVKDDDGNEIDDGIYFGKNLLLKEKKYELELGNFWTKIEKDEKYTVTIPNYYVLVNDNGDGIYKDNEDETYDYHDNTFQKISNPINHYFNFDTIVGSAFSSGTNAINNIINTSWIGEDFVDDNIIYNILKQTIRGIGNTFEEIIGKT